MNISKTKLGIVAGLIALALITVGVIQHYIDSKVKIVKDSAEKVEKVVTETKEVAVKKFDTAVAGTKEVLSKNRVELNATKESIKTEIKEDTKALKDKAKAKLSKWLDK